MSCVTISCKECKYHMDIQGLRTCGKYKAFLHEETVGCYDGEKNE